MTSIVTYIQSLLEQVLIQFLKLRPCERDREIDPFMKSFHRNSCLYTCQSVTVEERYTRQKQHQGVKRCRDQT